jgi:hypothetical protein
VYAFSTLSAEKSAGLAWVEGHPPTAHNSAAQGRDHCSSGVNMSSAASSTVASNLSALPVAHRDKFALGIALGMLAVNLVGFGPTLYLRPFFEVPPMPAYLYIHGVIGTAWFVLLVVQSTLVVTDNVRLHRRLGYIGAALAVAVIGLGIYTSARMVPRNVALGLTSETDIALYTVVTAADNAAFVIFSTFVLLGIYFRKRRDVHKRLMLLASWSILGPAAARILSWVAGFPNPVGPGRFTAAIIVLGFLVAILVYDIVTRRRPHLVTVLGIVFALTVNAGIQLSGIGPALVAERIGQ